MAAERRPSRAGVLVVDKPRGPTSAAIVSQARKRYGQRDIGHAGTLDPLATGVLVLLLGEATKLCDYLTAEDKGYEATVTFGVSTDTLDAEGTPLDVDETAAERVSDAALARALDVERARTLQVPPVHSAIKQAGRRAHRLARQGVHLDLPPRPVRVEHARLLTHTANTASFELLVSKGYYVRSFARDLCQSLGVPGHLSGLRRTRSGSFTLTEAVAWSPEPLDVWSTASLSSPLPLAEVARRALECVTLTDAGLLYARHGRPLDASHFVKPPLAPVSAWLDPNGQLVAIGEAAIDDAAPQEPPRFQVRRGFR